MPIGRKPLGRNADGLQAIAGAGTRRSGIKNYNLIVSAKQVMRYVDLSPYRSRLEVVKSLNCLETYTLMTGPRVHGVDAPPLQGGNYRTFISCFYEKESYQKAS